MKAVVIQLTGQSPTRATKVVLEERPEPTPGPGQILVKVAVSPLQSSDSLNTQGNFPTTTFPRIPGRDFAGTVVGPHKSKWHGQTVVGTSGPVLGFMKDGAHAEFVVVDEDAVVGIPSDLDSKQVSLLGTTWTTAYLALIRASVKSQEAILVLGAGGQVGNAVSQLAKSSLFRCRLLTAGRGPKYDVDLTASPDLAAVKDLTGGDGPDAVIDTTGDLMLQAAGLRQLAQRGRLSIISTGSASNKGTSVELDMKELYRKEHTIVGTNSVEHDASALATGLGKLLPLFQSEELHLPDISRYKEIKLGDTVDAYHDMAQGGRTKFLIVP